MTVGGSRKSALLHAMLASGAATVLGVEALSALHLIRQIPLLFLGAAALGVFAGVFRVQSRSLAPFEWSRPAHPLLLGCLVAIGAITLLTALVSAPNSWDSMTYHLARVAEWYDQGSVEHYYTAIDRQLWQPPFGEFLVLVGYGALGGRDYLANLPQWLAGLGAVLAGMEMARLLAASTRSQYVVGLFIASAPIVILESTSTQTDLLGGFWISCAAWLALRQYLAPGFAMRDALWFGAAVGLAIGTKGTAIPLGIPWIVLFLLPSLRAGRLRACAIQAATAALVVLALAGGHFLRNLEVFGNPIGPVAVQRMLRPASLTVPSLLSNFVAHLSLQMGTPWSGVNALWSRGVAAIHQLLGVDLTALYPYFGGFRIFGWTFAEDIAGNLVLTLLAATALGLLVASWRRISLPERFLAGGFLSGVMLFVFTVRWQPYIARLHTPMIVMLPACLLVPLIRRWPRVATAGMVAALGFALPPLLINPNRPLLPARSIGWKGSSARSILVEPRRVQYFAMRPELNAPYRNAVAAIERTGCGRLGLVAGYDSWEYPLWALGREHDLRFRHLHPDAVNAAADDAADGAGSKATPACAVVGLDQRVDWRPGAAAAGSEPLFREGPVTVWRSR